MTITREEILKELRELASGCFGLAIRQESFGASALTSGDWKAFQQSVDRAKEFLHEVDGPKIKTDCICTGNVQGESLMGRLCKLHGSSDSSKGAK